MSERVWRFYINDMIDFGEHVVAYSQGLDQASLVADRLHYDATIRNLELIREATTHVPEAVREANKDPVADDHCDAKQAHPRLLEHRQRHPVEHHPRRYPGAATEATCAAGRKTYK
jgi:hypothetical protein